ncbi:hypothetical protein BBJ28_00000736 [Nothophytophthora sp. Chile5]|nr:hypothetical protein BBJ28_00000736 [Nothophytophthora sp. Chile5]
MEGGNRLQVRNQELFQMLQSTKRDQIQAQQAAVEDERQRWKVTMQALQTELDQEKNDKEAQKCWQRKFLPSSVAPSTRLQSTINPTEDVFARFAQSLALLPASQAPQVTAAGVLPSLAHLLAQDMGDLVTGSVLLALVHLAIHRRSSRPRPPRGTADSALDVREQIVKAGVATSLAHLLEHSQNPRVVVEAARLCAALADRRPNKRVLASKNVVRFLVQHLMPHIPPETREKRENDTGEEEADVSAKLEKLPLPGDNDTQQNALSALVNLSHGTFLSLPAISVLLVLLLTPSLADSEILRSQIAASPYFLPIVVRYVREGASADVQTEAAKLLGNLAYNHGVNQSALMAAEAPTALAACLTTANLHRSPAVTRAGAIGLANLAHTSVNQLTIGYSGATTLLLQLLVDAVSHSPVVEAAAAALTCLCHQNPPNKTRVAAQNGLQVLLYALGASPKPDEAQHETGEETAALVALCECLGVVANTRPNRQQVLDLDGHLLLCQICQRCSIETPRLLEASAQAVCTLVPSPRERSAMLADNRESKLETKAVALKTLERARHLLAQETQRHPVIGEEAVTRSRRRWLTQAIDTLAKYHASSSKQQSASTLEVQEGEGETEQTLTEFRERSGFSMESLTSIPPDELCPHFFDEY